MSQFSTIACSIGTTTFGREPPIGKYQLGLPAYVTDVAWPDSRVVVGVSSHPPNT